MINSYKFDVIKTGFYLLVITSFSRPLISVLEGKTPLPLHKILPAGLFYLLLLFFILSFSSIAWDLVSIAILSFCCYAIASLMWGSNLNSLLEILLPFIGYFAAKAFVTDYSKVKLICIVFLVGYFIPIIGSAILMLFKLSVSYEVYGSGALRQHGLYVGFHTAAHSMVLFSFIYALFLTFKNSTGSIFQYAVHSVFLISIYCLLNTYVRSALLAFLIFWMVCLFRWKKRYFFMFLFVLIGVGIWQSSAIQSVFWKADTWDRERNLETASSGRTMLWSHNLNLFKEMPIYRKILGSGLGNESKRVIGGQDEIWSSHNDYIALLMTLGIIGLLLYLSIFVLLILDIGLTSNHNLSQGLILAAILASMCTSMVTNGYTFRIEASQTFWILMGCAHKYIKTTDDRFRPELF
jgi:O-antigen ligase